MRGIRKLVRSVWGRETTPATVLSILTALLWSAALFYDNDALAHPEYRYLRQMAEERTWAVGCLTLAAAQSGFVLFRAPPRLYFLEALPKMVAAIFWTTVTICMCVAYWPPQPEMANVVAVAVITWWDFIRWEPCRLCPPPRPKGCPYDA